MAEGDCPTDQWIEELQRTRKAADEAGIKLVLRDPSEIAQRDEPYFTQWIGTQETLIERGICTTEQFPAGRKRVANGDADGRDGVASWKTSAIRGGYFQHHVWWSAEFREQRAREIKPERSTPEHAGLEDPDDFADRCESFFMSLSKAMVSFISGEDESLRYDADTIAKVTSALEHARQLLQSSAPTRPRSVALREKRAATAKGDGEFRAFMAATLAPSQKPQRKAVKRSRGAAPPPAQ